MKKVIVRSAFYTNHRTKHTAVALSVDSEEFGGEQTVDSKEDTYARLWLGAISRIILGVQTNFEGDVHITLLSGQPEIGRFVEKIERLFIKMLESKKDITRERIERMVHAAGHFHKLPNDDLYADILTSLWNCKKTFNHFTFEQNTAGSPANAKLFNMARLMVAPDSVIKKRTSKVIK